MIGTLIIGFLTALLYCAVIILIAFAFVWGMRILGVNIDGEVYKWGKIVIGIICLIIMLTWLLSALGLAGSSSRYFRLGAAGGDATVRTVSTERVPWMLNEQLQLLGHSYLMIAGNRVRVVPTLYECLLVSRFEERVDPKINTSCTPVRRSISL